jgi:hypothetical protein
MCNFCYIELVLTDAFFFFFFQTESGKLITWGSTDDLGQSYLTSGKHGVLLELH